LILPIDHEVSRLAERRLGIPTPWSQSDNWGHVLSRWKVGDVLDLVTLVYQQIAQQRDRYGQHLVKQANEFRDEVRETFADARSINPVKFDRGGWPYRYHF